MTIRKKSVKNGKNVMYLCILTVINCIIKNLRRCGTKVTFITKRQLFTLKKSQSIVFLYGENMNLP